MTVPRVRPVEERPLVVLVCRVPLVAEAVGAALEEIADVHLFSGGGGSGGVDGLLRSLGPDAIVVDGAREADAASDYARESGAALVEIELAEQRLRVLGPDGWEETPDAPPSPETIRNLLVGRILGREAVRERR